MAEVNFRTLVLTFGTHSPVVVPCHFVFLESFYSKASLYKPP